ATPPRPSAALPRLTEHHRRPAFVVNGSFIRPRRSPSSPTRGTTHTEGFVACTCRVPAQRRPRHRLLSSSPPSHDRTALLGSRGRTLEGIWRVD
ncbi:hypothetical protein DFH09DRAFT_1367453, partial [Mycena vulgaris]